MSARKPLTVRIPRELYEDAVDLAAIQRIPIRELFERALRNEISRCREALGDQVVVLERMRQVRSRLAVRI